MPVATTLFGLPSLLRSISSASSILFSFFKYLQGVAFISQSLFLVPFRFSSLGRGRRVGSHPRRWGGKREEHLAFVFIILRPPPSSSRLRCSTFPFLPLFVFLRAGFANRLPRTEDEPFRKYVCCSMGSNSLHFLCASLRQCLYMHALGERGEGRHSALEPKGRNKSCLPSSPPPPPPSSR